MLGLKPKLKSTVSPLLNVTGKLTLGVNSFSEVAAMLLMSLASKTTSPVCPFTEVTALCILSINSLILVPEKVVVSVATMLSILAKCDSPVASKLLKDVFAPTVAAGISTKPPFLSP